MLRNRFALIYHNFTSKLISDNKPKFHFKANINSKTFAAQVLRLVLKVLRPKNSKTRLDYLQTLIVLCFPEFKPKNNFFAPIFLQRQQYSPP